jgi:hypothetical protein
VNPLKNHNSNQPIPNKNSAPFDYIPDGNGRDSYIIHNYGLKRNYQSKYQEYQQNLRINPESTPCMDAI